MNRIWTVFQREYISRVKKKSFLLATILTPLVFPAIIAGMVYFVVADKKKSQQEVVKVLDESGKIRPESNSKYLYEFIEGDLEEAKTAFRESKDFALIYIPEFTLEKPDGFMYYSRQNPSLSTVSDFEKDFENIIREIKLETYQVDREVLEKLKTSVVLRTVNLSDEGEKESSAGIAYGIGYAGGFLIYILIFVYGGIVMQGVIEEKSSKIVEIIVSSVRPFQLMLGKVLGIASVGITQFLIWAVLLNIFWFLAIVVLGVNLGDGGMEAANAMSGSQEGLDDLGSDPRVMNIMNAIAGINFLKIGLLFIFYFFGGYLLYGALFAAVGAAVDSPSEAQQFMFPITIPIIASIFGLFFVLEDPNSSLAFWLSIIPLSSPVVMMGRLGFGVPTWELILSMVLLVGGFFFTIWVAGRIYRVGILMQGSKVNYKVLAKWFMTKM